jgi:hypothetical protein
LNEDLESPEWAAANRDAVARAMEVLDGLANEPLPAVKAIVEQRRQAAAPAATIDGGDAGDEPSVGSSGSDHEDDGNDDQVPRVANGRRGDSSGEVPTRTPKMTRTMTKVSSVTNGRRWDSSGTGRQKTSGGTRGHASGGPRTLSGRI